MQSKKIISVGSEKAKQALTNTVAKYKQCFDDLTMVLEGVCRCKGIEGKVWNKALQAKVAKAGGFDSITIDTEKRSMYITFHNGQGVYRGITMMWQEDEIPPISIPQGGKKLRFNQYEFGKIVFNTMRKEEVPYLKFYAEMMYYDKIVADVDRENQKNNRYIVTPTDFHNRFIANPYV